MYSDHQDYYGGAYGPDGGYGNYGPPNGQNQQQQSYGYGGDPNQGYGQYGQQQQQHGGYPPPPGGGGFPGMMGGQMPFTPIMADFAKHYGENLVDQGKTMVDEKLQKFVSVSKLKYYFAVDTAYVMKKIGLLFFPFTHKDWSIHYDKNEDDAVQPRFEVNAPDLYIPLMAFITYILIAGVSLGMQQKFTPELLGIQCSSALGWLILELMIFTGCTYIIQTDLKVFDLLTFCAYKFVGMIFVLASSLIRTLKKQIYSVTTHEHVMSGNKRRLYFLLTLAGVQPLLMWWLTYHLTKW
ncbi:Protein YIF1B-B [Folsomia candida]|uniref:Protein YIF1 n=1 Tax=Folsomia candida TaxID=158441 RepID=A0A226DB50_FOLCA|nr:Protein YIF1B-B [Folsomia candida]